MADYAQRATALLRYEHGTSDRALLESLSQTNSLAPTARQTGLSRHAVSRALSRMEKHAARVGYDASSPDTSVDTGLPAHARSILQVIPEGEHPDGVRQIWHKVRTEDVTTAQLTAAMVEGIQVVPATPRPSAPVDCGRQFPVIVISDAHLGLLACGDESGEDWGTAQGYAALCEAIDHLVDTLPNVTEAMVVDLGDLTHTDGLLPTTARGSNVLDVDSRYFRIARAAGSLLRYAVERLRTKARRVHVRKIRGNHDDVTSWHLAEQLQAVYAGCPEVTVHTNDSYHQTHSWEGNLLVMTHGDKSKNDRLYEYVTTRWREEYGVAGYTHVLKGHIHHVTVEDKGDMRIETFSSLTHADAYHAANMHRARRTMQMICYRSGGGELGRVTYTPGA